MIYKRNSSADEAVLDVAKRNGGCRCHGSQGSWYRYLLALILDGEDKDRLSAIMRDIADETGADFVSRDAENVDNSVCIVLMATRNKPIGLTDCGFLRFRDLRRR